MAADAALALSVPTTGADAPLADPVVKGYRLAIKIANETMKLPGRVVENVQDDQDKPEVGATVARKLCGTRDVVGVVGNFASSINIASGPIYEDCGLARISPTASNDSLSTKGWKHFYRVCAKNSDQIGEGLSWIARNWPDAKRMAIVSPNDASGNELANFAAEGWAKAGGQITDRARVSAGTGDYRGVLTSILANAPDIVFIGTFDTDGGLIVKQARQLGYRGRFFGTDGLAAQNFIDVGGAANVEGVHFTNLGYDPAKIASASRFVDAYKAAYGEAPSAFAANAYDATMVLIEAWRRGGAQQDRAAVARAVAAGTFDGVFGPISFTGTGDAAVSQIGIYRVGAGKIEYAARSTDK